jgi:hypothetical protein
MSEYTREDAIRDRNEIHDALIWLQKNSVYVLDFAPAKVREHVQFAEEFNRRVQA